MNNEISQRIKLLVKQSGLSMRELSKRMNLGNPISLSQWARGAYEPSKKAVEVMAEYFGVSPAYILYGEGEAPKDEGMAPDSISIPLYNVQASCGGGSFIESPELILRSIRVSSAFLRRYAPTARPDSLHIITVAGDSMAPTVEDGDAVIVDISDTAVRRDGFYAIQMNGALFVKRLQILPSGLRIISDNIKYPPIDVGEQDTVHVIGRCYACAQIRALI